MECIKRIVNKYNYIEFILSDNKSNKLKKYREIFIQIIKSIDNLSINDFEIDLICDIPKFKVYKDKEKIYMMNLHEIEKNILELYNKKIIIYGGYQ